MLKLKLPWPKTSIKQNIGKIIHDRYNHTRSNLNPKDFNNEYISTWQQRHVLIALAFIFKVLRFRLKGFSINAK